jgi:nitroreductase
VIIMTTLNLSCDQVLTTTRAVRKRLDFDRPVPLEVIEECLQIGLQAPSGSNSQGWHFMLVTDEAKKAEVAKWYQKSFAVYEAGPAQPTKLHTDDPSMQQTQRMQLTLKLPVPMALFSLQLGVLCWRQESAASALAGPHCTWPMKKKWAKLLVSLTRSAK